MIDLITLTKNNLTDTEVRHIVTHNQLQTNSKAGKIYFDNMNKKNTIDGFYLRIEANRLKLTINIHKHRNKNEGKGFTNYDLLTMQQAIKEINLLTKDLGLNTENMCVSAFEIGANLQLSKDCGEYMDKIHSIGILDERRLFYVNPKYKKMRVKTTEFYRERRKVFKIYDKVFEMREKRQGIEGIHPYILRIETSTSRVEKMTVKRFLSGENIKKISNQFIKDWGFIHFQDEIVVPQSTRKNRVDLCKEILMYGADTVLNNSKQAQKDGHLTEKQYRTIREFIQHEWGDFKKQITINQSFEEMEFKQVFNEVVCILIN